MNDQLRSELETIREADQALRKQAMEIAQEHGISSPQYEEIRSTGKAMDRRHVDRLLEIVEQHGWPGATLVGRVACQGAFLVLQHADLATQKKLLPTVREATRAGDIEATSLPLLEDRVRMLEGEMQIYGTQLTRGADGNVGLWPIEDEAHVEDRRAAAGLEPLTDYLKRFGLGDRKREDENG